jgi:hypothetical protein
VIVCCCGVPISIRFRYLKDAQYIVDFVARIRCSKCEAKWPQISVWVAPLHTGGM